MRVPPSLYTVPSPHGLFHFASLHTVLARIGERQIPLPPAVAMLLGLAGLVVVLGSDLWQVATHVYTVVHEASHAIAGIGAGRRIRHVKINKDGSGETLIHPAGGAGYGLAAFAGYAGPSVAGLISAGLISAGRIVAVLWLGLLLVVGLLFLVRESFGGLVVLACGILLGLIVRFTSVGTQTAVAYLVAWFLLGSGPKAVFRAGSKPQDAKILAGLTRVWAPAWPLLWLAGSVAALAGGAAILL